MKSRSTLVAVIFMALVVLIPAEARCEPATPDGSDPFLVASPDLSGKWGAKLRGAIRGEATLDIVQIGATGTFTGKLLVRHEEPIPVHGHFALYGRELNGDMTIERSAPLMVKFLGRATWRGSRFKWTITMLDGTEAKLRAHRVTVGH